MNEKQKKSISRFLSLVLRHQPEKIGIQPDQNGWVDVNDLIMKARHYGVELDLQLLQDIVATNDKKRFAFDETSHKIRASQGHSIDIELGYIPQRPPEILFHGTGENSLQSILVTGLERRSRQHVHLSIDLVTAVKVGQRHGRPVVLKVLAGEMHIAGHEFFLSENGVWLTKQVPAEYLKLNVE